MMELNAEQIKKALKGLMYEAYATNGAHKPYLTMRDALSLINSQEQRIKELTEELEKLKKVKYIFSTVDYCSDDLAEALEENKRLTEENERLQKALNTDMSIVRVSRGSGKTAHLREVGRIRVDAIRAYTVRKMQEEINKTISGLCKGDVSEIHRIVDQVAKEMVVGNK